MTEEKKFGLFELVSFLISGIIVLDTFVAPAALGVSAITLWIVVAILFMIPNGFINAELGAAYPDGLVSWVKESMGEFHATITGWFYWVNVAFWMPAVFIVFTYWFSMAFFPDGDGWTTLGSFGMIVIALVACWGLVLTVRRGIDLGMLLSKIATVLKIGVLVLFGVLGLLYTGETAGEVFQNASWIPEFSDLSSLGLITAIVFNLLGFELIASIGHRVKEPEKNIPKAIIIGAILIAGLYIFATVGVLRVASVADLADEGFIIDGFYIALERMTEIFGSAQSFMFKLIMGATLFTLIANMISWVIGANEILEDAQFAKTLKVFNERHPKYGTLSKSYILMGVISSILIIIGLGLGDSGDEAFWTILAFSMVIFIFPYIYLTPAILKLRKRDGVEARSFVVPGGNVGLWVAAILNFVFIALAVFLLLAFNPGYDLYYPVVIIGTLLTIAAGLFFYYRGKQFN
ncbi:MAG: Inner membrane transporter YcaM [Candidatus Izimaplasma bacterium HR2]|nr:MAG: Inner membrane transporter YcaM [Candidatus Izimaplasma bacterium HR2]